MDSEPLVSGDVVEIVGSDTAVVGDLPVILVKKASSASTGAVLGPVDCALRLDPVEVSETSKRSHRLQYGTPQYHVHKRDGAIQPGDYGRIVTLGAYRAIKVDASFGAVHPGDLLVSSPRPGYAMKAIDPKLGTVIGKALNSLPSGPGVVPVLVQAR